MFLQQYEKSCLSKVSIVQLQLTFRQGLHAETEYLSSPMLVEQLSLCLEMCLDSYGNDFSNTARSFGRLACYETRFLLFDTPTLSAFCECSFKKRLAYHRSKNLFALQISFNTINSQKQRMFFPIFIFKFHYSFCDIHNQQLTSQVNHR